MTRDSPLRDALIESGLALLREGGPAGLTLRRAAMRAGVSHAAPAHHFDGLPGLATAMATRAYDAFTAAMLLGRDAAAPDPTAQLLGVGQGYLDFAATDAGLFHLIFVSDLPDRDDPDLAAAGAAAYGVLRAACLPFGNGKPDPEIEIAIWSLIHGYALLGLANPASPKRRLIAVPPFAPLIRTYLAGLACRMPLAFPADRG